MKRIVSIALVIFVLASLFAGCNGNSVEGSYKLKTALRQTGTRKPAEDKLSVTLDGESMEFTRKNGQLSGSAAGLTVTLAK